METTFEFHFVDIHVAAGNDGQKRICQVPADPTTTPGLVITPGYDFGKLTGFWGVTHFRSGMSAFGEWSFEFKLAHEIARRLGDLDIDWTADGDTIAALAPQHMDAFAEIFRTAQVSDADQLTRRVSA